MVGRLQRSPRPSLPNAVRLGRTSRPNFRKPHHSSRHCLMPRWPHPGSSSMIFALSRANRISAAGLQGGTCKRVLQLWIGDRIPRKIDVLSLTSMSDAFFGRVFHARRELMPFGTVSLTTYFHADTQDLAAGISARSGGWPTPKSSTRVLGTRTVNCGLPAGACSQPRIRSRISRPKEQPGAAVVRF